MACLGLDQAGPAFVCGLWASVEEQALVGRVDDPGWGASHGPQRLARRVQTGKCLEKALCVWMERPREQSTGVGTLDDHATVHYGHGVRHLRDNPKVMRYQQNGGVAFLSQHVESMKHLRL